MALSMISPAPRSRIHVMWQTVTQEARTRRALVFLLLFLLVGQTGSAALAQDRWADTAIDVQSLLTLAEMGDARASFLLGTRYASGRAGVRDDSEAVRWFEKAAQEGLAEAQHNLGIMYATGRGVAQDWSQAVRWYRRAAEQGTPEAQYNLGTLYGLGRGVKRDERQAAEWLRKAAEGGLPEAQYNLAVLYEYGRGVPLDAGRAMDWYREAADSGHESAKARFTALQARLKHPAGGAGSSAGRQPLMDAQSAPAADPLRSLRTTQWLAEQHPGHYVLQMSSHKEEGQARRFIRRHALESRAAYFPFNKGDITWYSVVMGAYPTREKAQAALASLSPELKKNRPWVRKMSTIHRSMNR